MRGPPKGSFVRLDEHPEFGAGRVVGADDFATRVVFPFGGLRVFRHGDTDRLTRATAPSESDLLVLDAIEAAFHARSKPL